MNDHTFLQVQAVQLREMLQGAGDDPILVPQLRQRLADIEEDLRKAEQSNGELFLTAVPSAPRAALFLQGGGVEASTGIRPSLAGEALIQYERMFVEQALHDEREAARTAGRQRRPRGAPVPALLFTGTPRGSFGLEFATQRAEDESLLEIHSRSLEHVAEALVQVSASDCSLEQVIRNISPRVLRPMKKFLSVLAQHGAEIRLAFSAAPSQSISGERIKLAAERLDRELEEAELEASGTFRGLTRESLVFDLIADDGVLITGSIADHLTEDDLDRINELTNNRCVASLQKTTLRQLGGAPRESYLLLDAKPEH